jgi:hypothetical protein
MRLYEEYLYRHGIHDVPLAHHCSFSSLFLQMPLVLPKNTENFWTATNARSGFFECIWSKTENRPGQYQVGFYYIPHDSMRNGSVDLKYYSITSLRWDEYENFMFGMASRISPGQILSPDKAMLCAWEMFVHGCDSWFAQQYGDIKYLLFQTLDKENSDNERLGYHKELLRRIYSITPSLVKSWDDEIYHRLHFQSDWLVELIESLCKRNTPQ